MARINNLCDFLTDIANAIRSKKGTSETIPAEDFDTEIENLPSGSGDYNVKVDMTKTYTTGNNGGIRTLITEIGDIDTGAVTNMNYMFGYCANLTTIPLLDTGNVTNMASMFNGCTSLTTIPLLDTSNATDTSRMFYNCSNLTVIPQLDVSKTMNTNYMFTGCTSLTSVIFNNTSTCTPANVNYMFSNCVALTHIDLRSFDFSNITTYSNYSSTFGESASNGVPDNCEIIVADDTQKTWITSKFSRLTNVKTVAEYEAE